MSLFSTEIFIQSLADLRHTKESTTALSLYVVSNYGSLDKIMSCIKMDYSESNVYHQLTLFYLCHEILNYIRTKKNKEVYKKLYDEIKCFLVERFGDLIAKPDAKEGLKILHDYWVEKKIITKEDFLEFGRNQKREKKVDLGGKATEQEIFIKKIESIFDDKILLKKFLEDYIKKI